MKKTGANARPTIKEKMILPALFLLVLVALALVGILPTTKNIEKTGTEITELKAGLKRQQALLPIHMTLQQEKKRTLPEGISVNKIKPLNIADLAELPEVFEGLARESKVELVSVTPQVRSLKGDREMVQVDARLRGEFLTFKTLLRNLNKMVFIDTIESLSIDVTKLGQEMNLSVWLAIK